MAMSRAAPSRLTVHQVHPAKLATDISAAVVSSVLLWRGRTTSGLLVRYLAPVAGSAAALAFGDMAKLADTRRGRYVQRHMPPSMQALRLAGDVVMTVAAARRKPGLLALGGLIVIAGWSHGLTAAARRRAGAQGA